MRVCAHRACNRLLCDRAKVGEGERVVLEKSVHHMELQRRVDAHGARPHKQH